MSKKNHCPISNRSRDIAPDRSNRKRTSYAQRKTTFTSCADARRTHRTRVPCKQKALVDSLSTLTLVFVQPEKRASLFFHHKDNQSWHNLQGRERKEMQKMRKCEPSHLVVKLDCIPGTEVTGLPSSSYWSVTRTRYQVNGVKLDSVARQRPDPPAGKV